MKKNGILGIMIIVFAVLDAIVLIGGGSYLLIAKNSIKGINITPDFVETELAVNSQYTFSVEAVPAGASLKKAEGTCSDMSATFELSKDGKSATLITGGSEGTVTLSVKYKDMESNVLTFQVIDVAAREAAARAEAEAAAAAEAEAAAAAEAEAAAAAAAKMYVRMTGDNVNVRAQNNTDCDVLGKAKKGETFEKVENVDEWTHIIYNGQDGYVKTEFLQEITEEEAMSAPAPSEEKQEDKKEEKKEEQQEEQKPEEPSAEEKAKAAEAAAAEAAQKAAEELAAQQAALAAAAAAAGPTLECADGNHTFTQAQYNFLKGFWYREGQTGEDDWKAYAHKHTYDECVQICQIEGGL